MSDATKVTPLQKGMTQSRKGKALLIALANLNIIFILTTFTSVDVTIAGQMITAILFLVGAYLGTQGGIDIATAWKSNTASSKTTNETITKKYEYKMDYVDGAEK